MAKTQKLMNNQMRTFDLLDVQNSKFSKQRVNIHTDQQDSMTFKVCLSGSHYDGQAELYMYTKHDTDPDHTYTQDSSTPWPRELSRLRHD